MSASRIQLSANEYKQYDDILKGLERTRNNYEAQKSALTEVEKEVYGLNSEGIFVLAYYKADELVCVEEYSRGEYGRSECLYFFNGEQTFLIETIMDYSRHLFEDDGTELVVTTHEPTKRVIAEGAMYLLNETERKLERCSDEDYQWIVKLLSIYERALQYDGEVYEVDE